MKIFYLKILLFNLLLSCSAFSVLAQRSNGIAVQGKVNVQEGSVIIDYTLTVEPTDTTMEEQK